MALPDWIWEVVLRPIPAWPWSIEPDFEPAGIPTPLHERGFTSAARGSFGFLAGLGFAMTPADAWDVSKEVTSISWERDDALVLATLTEDGTFWAIVGPRSDDVGTTPVREQMMHVPNEERVAIGSLPILGATPELVANALRAYATVIDRHLSPILADRPIGWSQLRAAAEATIEEISRPRLIAHYSERAEAAWSADRYEAFIEACERLADLGEATCDELRLDEARARRRPPLSLGEADLPEAERIRRAAALVSDAHARASRAAVERHELNEAWGTWEDASREWREAMDLLYPDAFWETVERVRSGDGAAIDEVITFLEVDPWVFRSGYAKQTIMRRLRQADLDETQATRLRAVLLLTIDAGYRLEFRESCRLARRVVDDGLRVALLSRLRSTDADLSRRAMWMLSAVGETLGPDDRAIVLRHMESAAGRDDWWRSSRWVRRYAARYGDDEWFDEILARGLRDGRDGGLAKRLLSVVPARPTTAQRNVLGTQVLAQIEAGDDEGWLEDIAVISDSAEFRAKLIRAYMDAPDEEVRRRAWWAINAIRLNVDETWPGDALG